MQWLTYICTLELMRSMTRWQGTQHRWLQSKCSCRHTHTHVRNHLSVYPKSDELTALAAVCAVSELRNVRQHVIESYPTSDD